MHAILDRHGLDYELDWLHAAAPFLTAEGELVAAVRAAVRAVTGIEPELSTTGGTSDGRFIIDICPQVLELGPVNASIHKLNEHIELDCTRCAQVHLSAGARAPAAAGLNPERNRPLTLRAVLREAVTQFKRAGLAFGHGTHNARDEAIYLILHTLKLPLDELDSVLDAAIERRRTRCGARHSATARARAHSCRLSDP